MAVSRPLRAVMVLGSTGARHIGPRIGAYMRSQLEIQGADVQILDPRTAEDGYFLRMLERPLWRYRAELTGGIKLRFLIIGNSQGRARPPPF